MNKVKSIAFHTLGCKLNFSETDSIARRLGGLGYPIVPFDEASDMYVINSCTVTQKAEKRCRELIKKIRKSRPGAQIVIMGCYSQVRAKELRNIPGVTMVLDNTQKFALAERLKEPTHTPSGDGAYSLPDSFFPAFSAKGRTRTFFKIQDGCDYGCAYCAIPHARGRSRSNTIEQTMSLAREIAQSTTREVVLTGVNIGDFGKPHGETFSQLLARLAATEGLPRIRLSSIEPDLLHDDIIDLVAEKQRLMPHFHIPLQSGSDTILAAMGRKYDTALFAERVNSIRNKIPHACIAADIITGYPGETEALFEESYSFVSKIDVSYIHVFPYSERRNTRAAKSGEQVHPAERKRRSGHMQQLSQEKKKAFIAAAKNTTAHVLWENLSNNGFMYGFTENYIKAKTVFEIARTNTIEPVRLSTTDRFGVYTIE